MHRPLHWLITDTCTGRCLSDSWSMSGPGAAPHPRYLYHSASYTQEKCKASRAPAHTRRPTPTYSYGIASTTSCRLPWRDREIDPFHLRPHAITTDKRVCLQKNLASFSRVLSHAACIRRPVFHCFVLSVPPSVPPSITLFWPPLSPSSNQKIHLPPMSHLVPLQQITKKCFSIEGYKSLQNSFVVPPSLSLAPSHRLCWMNWMNDVKISCAGETKDSSPSPDGSTRLSVHLRNSSLLSPGGRSICSITSTLCPAEGDMVLWAECSHTLFPPNPGPGVPLVLYI